MLRMGKFFEYVRKMQKCDYNLGYNIFYNRGGILETFNNSDEGDDYIDHLHVENMITEWVMINHADTWERVRGGRYVRFDVKYKFPRENIAAAELPVCKCKLPCDAIMHAEGYIYFRCPRKNMWDGFREEFEIDDNCCNFFAKFTKDTEFRAMYEKRKSALKILTSKSRWLNNIPNTNCVEICIGGCGRPYDGDYTVRCGRRAINLCFDCLIKKYRDLEKKYDTSPIGFSDD